MCKIRYGRISQLLKLMFVFYPNFLSVTTSKNKTISLLSKIFNFYKWTIGKNIGG